MATALFIKAEDLKKNTIIDGSVDTDKFMYQIKIAQEIHIQNYLGTDLYARLQAGIIAADLTANETTLINTYIQPALIHFAMAQYLPFAAYQVTNGGIFKYLPENTSAVDKTEVDYLVQQEKTLSEYYTKRLIDYLCNNSTLYPQYSTNTGADISPETKLTYGGWYLG